MRNARDDRLRPVAAGAVFVFGSNLAGIHGAGSALRAAREYGAKRGVCAGPTGRAYAIPTQDERLKTLPLHRLRDHVAGFVQYAVANPDRRFHVVRIGCGLAGCTDDEIAPMFRGVPSTCDLPYGWLDYWV